jgi:micrococcal nuclease
MGGFLTFLGLVGLGLGLVALVKGSIPALHLASRKGAGGVIAASLVALVVGGSLLPPVDETSTEASPSPSPTPSEELVLESPSPARPAGVPTEAQEASVTNHIDGDTLWLEGGTLPAAAASTVRLLEIDAPEAGATFGTEATNFLSQELPIGAKVYLLADQGDTDRFGRYLRYLWKDNGEFFNEKAVRQGIARAVLIPPNDRYIVQIRAAEAEARAAKRGLWASTPTPAQRTAAPRTTVPETTQPRTQPPVVPAPQPPAGECHPSYAGVCVPIASDVDCPGGSGNGPEYAPGRNFRVVGPDVYDLDGNDNDGLACES